MAKKKFVWEVYLRPNTLTKDNDRDCIADGTEHKVTRRLSVNQPSQIIARVPSAVPEGKVTVVVKTKYTGGAIKLKEVREIIFKLPCSAKA